MKSILYITDLYYPAKGRNYYEEDLYITSYLKDYFNILIAHPQQAIPFINMADLIVVRNSGPVIDYQEYFNEFVRIVKQKNIPIYNSLDGKADIKGKQYLLDLTLEKYPVIPSIDKLENLHLLGEGENFLMKTKFGADSIGMRRVNKNELSNQDLSNYILQPFINFKYEVSFYYVDGDFQYALYAPDKDKRWELTTFNPSKADLNFADSFIQWNNIQCGIQRVDACRLQDDSLMLVELEDLNPFLSLDALSEEKQLQFLKSFKNALSKKTHSI